MKIVLENILKDFFSLKDLEEKKNNFLSDQMDDICITHRIQINKI
jgi:hypothetical protein